MAKLTRKLITITEQQNAHLNTLSAQTGIPVTEIVRQMISNSNDVNFKQIVALNETKVEEYKKLKASYKYFSYLFENATNNINQIAKHANTNRNLDNLVLNELSEIKKQLVEIRGDIREYCESNSFK